MKSLMKIAILSYTLLFAVGGCMLEDPSLAEEDVLFQDDEKLPIDEAAEDPLSESEDFATKGSISYTVYNNYAGGDYSCTTQTNCHIRCYHIFDSPQNAFLMTMTECGSRGPFREIYGRCTYNNYNFSTWYGTLTCPL